MARSRCRSPSSAATRCSNASWPPTIASANRPADTASGQLDAHAAPTAGASPGWLERFSDWAAQPGELKARYTELRNAAEQLHRAHRQADRRLRAADHRLAHPAAVGAVEGATPAVRTTAERRALKTPHAAGSLTDGLMATAYSATVLEVAQVPVEHFLHQVRCVLARDARALVQAVQHRLEVGVRAVLDDRLGPLLGRQATQVGEPLLGDQHLDVARMVGMRDHRYDARDRPRPYLRRRHEDRQVAAAREVARTADAVHDLGAHDVRRIDVAVDVRLDHAVHRDDAEAADHFRVLHDLLRAQDDLR